MLESTARMRRRQLKKVIQEIYDNDYALVAKKVGRSEGTLRKYLAQSSNRNISDNLARKIEVELELPDEYLDVGDTNKNLVYFVLLSLNRHSTEVVEWIHKDFTNVIDCAIIYGDYDIFIKISVPNTNQLEFFFKQIMRHPKVLKTKTFATVNNLRFQRKQEEFINLENSLEPTGFIEKQKKKRIESLLAEINSIEKKDRLIVNEFNNNLISPVEIMDSVKERFWSTRYYGEQIRAKRRYFIKEREKIKNGVESKRIFLIRNEYELPGEESSTFDEMIDNARELTDIGCEVRFIQEGDWIPGENLKEAKSFAIIDRSYVYTREQGKKDARLDYNEEYIEKCISLFKANWDDSRPLSDFEPLDNLTVEIFFKKLHGID